MNFGIIIAGIKKIQFKEDGIIEVATNDEGTKTNLQTFRMGNT